MGIRDWFKSDDRKVAELAATMNGVDPRGLTKMTEVSEWMAELKEDDIRRQRIPQELLEDQYYLFSNNREYGTVTRVTKDNLEVRLPFEVDLPTGIRVPYSHVFRRLPVRALAALDGQRAQKVIRNVNKDATKCYQQHIKLCEVCFNQQPPKRYPGNPEVGVLGPPADKFTICASCLKKSEAKNKAEQDAAREAEAAAAWEQKRAKMRGGGGGDA